jgi:hypothetical protein
MILGNQIPPYIRASEFCPRFRTMATYAFRTQLPLPRITYEGCGTPSASVSSWLVHVLCKCWKSQKQQKAYPKKVGFLLLSAFDPAAATNIKPSDGTLPRTSRSRARIMDLSVSPARHPALRFGCAVLRPLPRWILRHQTHRQIKCKTYRRIARRRPCLQNGRNLRLNVPNARLFRSFEFCEPSHNNSLELEQRRIIRHETGLLLDRLQGGPQSLDRGA